jgi:hypothetical protein
VGKPNELMVLAGTAMTFDNPAQHPTPDQIKAAMDRVRAALPTQVAGPKAGALFSIVMERSAQGDIAGAQTAEAELEAEPRDILVSQRDPALAAIAAAQAKAGDAHGALATALRITGTPLLRWNTLLKLAAVPPTQ